MSEKMWGSEHDAVRRVVADYLEGIIWGDEEICGERFTPGPRKWEILRILLCFFPLEEFIAWVKLEETQAVGTACAAVLPAIEATGTVAIAKLSDTCFGTELTD